MKINKRGIAIEEHFESLHDGDLTVIGLQPKKDPRGIWTVGFGRALRDIYGDFLRGDEDKDEAYKQYPSLTIEQARIMLAEDNAFVESHVRRYVKVALNSDQFSALVSFTYNIGVEAFHGSTLLRLLNDGKYQEASQQFRRWDKSGGKVYRGLIRRRNNEKRLFLSQPFNFEDES